MDRINMSFIKFETGSHGEKDSGYNSFVGLKSMGQSAPNSFHSEASHGDQNDFNETIELGCTSNHHCAPLKISTPCERPASRFYHSTVCATKRRLIFAEKHPANVSSLDEGTQWKKQRPMFCHVSERLDLIAMLEHYPMMETILQYLNARELQTMTFVSQKWRQIVFSSRKASKRLRQFQMKQISLKENAGSMPSVLNKQPSNYFSFSNGKNDVDTTVDRSSDRGTSMIQDDFITNQKVVKTLRSNEHLVKCPRCGKGSKILYTSKDLSSNSVEENEISFECSKTLPINSTNSDCKNMFRKFFSVDLDLQSSTSHFQNENNSFGECTGITCNYRFCLKCCGIYHPGEMCSSSVLRTPSKIQLTKNKKTLRPSTKLKKTALKRLCF